MICPPCQQQAHDKCIDVGRDTTIPCSYGSCDCQHRTSVLAEPATGEAGE